MSTSHFYFYKDSSRQWRWRFIAKNGKTIADSAESYHHLVDCEHGAKLLKVDAAGAPLTGDDDYKKARS